MKTNRSITLKELKQLIGEHNYNALIKHKALRKWIRDSKIQGRYTRQQLGYFKAYKNFSAFLLTSLLWHETNNYRFWEKLYNKCYKNENK